jgi:hypothetical protein
VVRAQVRSDGHRLAELIAVVEEMALNVRAESIPVWLGSYVPALDGAVPAELLAGGGYERVMDLTVGLSAGIFT